MTEKELRKLSRVELLEMLVEMSKQNERLQANLKNQAEQHQTQIDQIKNDYQNRIKDGGADRKLDSELRIKQYQDSVCTRGDCVLLKNI